MHDKQMVVSLCYSTTSKTWHFLLSATETPCRFQIAELSRSHLPSFHQEQMPSLRRSSPDTKSCEFVQGLPLVVPSDTSFPLIPGGAVIVGVVYTT